MRLLQLTAGHLDAVLAFEVANRAYFAAAVPDRGEEFFTDYPKRHAALLAMQAAGTDRFHVLLDDGGVLAGRVNLVDITDGGAELGYRIGQGFAGRGAATDAVRQAVALAGGAYGLRRLRAETTLDNHGSRKVLLRNGFTPTGEIVLDGRPGLRFALDLAPAAG